MSTPIEESLNLLLADYSVLYQKLRNYHWNLTGRMFFQLHVKFEELYTATAVTVDDLAERLVALGTRPVSTYKEQLAIARIQEDETVPKGTVMAANIMEDMKALTAHLRTVSARANEAGDTATANLADGIADGQEKTVWMLRAFLED